MTPSAPSPAFVPDDSAYTFRECHTYNRSWNGTASIARNDFLQRAYEVGIESTLATTYRVGFSILYFSIVIWGAHQYGVHGRRRRLWCDNRQIVVQSLLWCSLLRGLQFLLKVVTDCNGALKAVDELFTALETVFQFLAFVLLIAFWIELQIGMKKGLQNLRKTRNPVIAFSITFSTLRLVEFVFIVLSKSPNSFPAAGISLFENVALAFRVLSMLVYAAIMTVAGYWGIKLLRSLRSIEDQSRMSQMPANLRNSKASSGYSTDRRSKAASRSTQGSVDMGGAEADGVAVDSVESGHSVGWTVRGTMSATAKSTKKMMRKIRRASTTTSAGHIDSAKTRAFRQKVVRMTLFMLLEVLTVVVWLVFYGILFTMRGSKGSEAAKVTNPRSYLIFKYFEKFCEWMTIMVLCGTMIAGSRTKTAKDAATKRSVGIRHKPSGGGIGFKQSREAGAKSKNATKRSGSSESNSGGGGSGSSHGEVSDAVGSTAVSVGIVGKKDDHEGQKDTRVRGSSWSDADSFNVLGNGAAREGQPSARKPKKWSTTRASRSTKQKSSANPDPQSPIIPVPRGIAQPRKKSFPPDAEVVRNPAMAHRM